MNLFEKYQLKKFLIVLLIITLTVLNFTIVPVKVYSLEENSAPMYDATKHYDATYNSSATAARYASATKYPNGYNMQSSSAYFLSNIKLSNLAIKSNADYYIRTVLTAGTECISNQNEKFMGPILVVRNVTLDGVEGMLQLRFLKDCGGAMLYFDTSYTSVSDTYLLKTFNYYDGRTTLDNENDMEIAVYSGVDSLKVWLNDVLCLDYAYSECSNGTLSQSGIGAGVIFKYCKSHFTNFTVWCDESNRTDDSANDYNVSNDYSSDDAYFHDQGGIYMSPLEPTSSEVVTVRFRTPKQGIEWVSLQYTSSANDSNVADGWYQWNPMTKVESICDNGYDLWEGTIPARSDRYKYRFYINTTSGKQYFYSYNGISVSKPTEVQCFSVWPGFSTPNWSKGAYWYSLVPTSFYNGDILNDVSGDIADLTNGNKMNGYNHRASYGGDIKGVIKKLSYIKELGCTGVYMNPLWPSYDAAGYGMNNAYMIDPQYGTEQDLSDLVDKLHSKDMRFMMDVLVHSVTDYNLWYNSYDKYPDLGAYQSQDSLYYNLFKFNSWPTDPVKFLSSIALDYSNSLTRKLMFQDSDSYLKRYLAQPYNVDAYRFDAGAYLYGTDMTLNEITSMITSELKTTYSDKLLVCENYTDDNNSSEHLKNGWDSCWNTAMIYAIRNFAEGTNSVTQLKKNSISHIQSWPRSMALSMYVPITTHDFSRLQNSADASSIRAAKLFQMTFLGSPSLYYGDETNAVDTDSSINSFNWDTSEWDVENFEFTKALGKLRTDYSCLKDGIVKYGTVDTSNKLMSFARWDNNGSVVTVVNNSDTSKVINMDVHQFEIEDGTVLTDYLTDRRYTVMNGYISATIPAGGSVFVTGIKTADSVNQWNKVTLKETTDNIMLESDGKTLRLSGNASNRTQLESGIFANREFSGAFELSSEFSSESGSAALEICSDASLSMVYSVLADFENNLVKIYANGKGEEKSLIAQTTFNSNTIGIKIIRNGNNEFSACIYDGNGWTSVNGSSKYISMPTTVLGGVTPINGKVWMRNAEYNFYDSKYYNGFIGNKNTSEFTIDSNDYELSDEKLCFKGDEQSTYLTDCISGDKTVKSAISSELSSGGFVGTTFICEQDGVFGGRYHNGKEKVICLARIVNGSLVVYNSVADKHPESELKLQLQKIGNTYTLSYKYVDEYLWKTLENSIFASFSSVNAGVISKNSNSFIDYVTLGDAIDGGTSLCIPITKHEFKETDFKAIADANQMIKWSTNNDTWENVTGGVKQTDNSVRGYYKTNNQFTNFRAEVTVEVIDSTAGYAGIIFASSNASSINNGYLIKVFKDGRLQLLKNGSRIITQTTIDLGADSSVRLIIERIGDRIIIYAGDNCETVINVIDTTYISGYFGFMTNYCIGYFGNFNVFSLDSAWSENNDTYLGSGKIVYSNQSVSIDATSGNLATINEKGVGFTDAFVTAEIDYTEPSNDVGYAGFGFATAQGTDLFANGVVVAIENRSSVVLYCKGTEKARVSVTASDVFNLSVSVKNGVYEVFIGGDYNPIISCKLDVYGGIVAMVAKNTTAIFSDFCVEDINGIVKEESVAFHNSVTTYEEKNVTPNATISSNAEYIAFGNNGHSHSFRSYSGYFSNEYVSYKFDGISNEDKFVIEGVLTAGSSSLDNTNMSLYNAPVITFRQVEDGYLQLTLTAKSGGASITFSSGYTAEDSYVKFFDYDDGTQNRNDNVDNRFKIVSDDETVSVWYNGTCILDNYNYSTSYKSIAPAAGVSFKCCAGYLDNFKISKVANDVIFHTAEGGSLKVLNNQYEEDGTVITNDTLIIKKSGKIRSGTFNVYALIDNSVIKITPKRVGYRNNKYLTDSYYFQIPETNEPLVITCEFEEKSTANLAMLEPKYMISDNSGILQFTTRFGYSVKKNKFELNGELYTVQGTGTLVTTMSALEEAGNSHDKLMRLDSKKLWDGREERILDLKRTKYYDYCNEYIDFCAAITDISESEYDKVYVARGYVKATDSLGEEHVFYSNVIYSSISDLKE